MPEIPTPDYTTMQAMRRAREERGMQESCLEEVSRIRAQQMERAGISEIYSTLDAMTARYMRDCPVSVKRSSNLKVLAKKEKEILNENKSTNR